MRTKKVFIKSGKDSIYVELQYPKKLPANCVIVAHGLRSYYPGFLDMFMKAVREAGFIAVKFHFVGTGKSSGKFEEKTMTAMFQNYLDVLKFLKQQPEIKNIGLVGRSNAGSIATLAGPDPRIKAYVFLAPASFYSQSLVKFVKNAEIRGKFFYHKSFKRPHTKGPGRLPLNYLDNARRYDQRIMKNVSKMKPVIFFQCTEDEAVRLDEGHFDYWKKHLPKPSKLVLIQGGNHSYKSHKRFVIREGIKWLKKYLD